MSEVTADYKHSTEHSASRVQMKTLMPRSKLIFKLCLTTVLMVANYSCAVEDRKTEGDVFFHNIPSDMVLSHDEPGEAPTPTAY